MGWKLKVLVAFVGLVSFGLGAWLLGVVCFLYLLLALRSKKPSKGGGGTATFALPRRLLAGALLLMAALAFASGGAASPLVFLAAGATLLLWPGLARVLPIAELVPEGDSILLKSRYIPIFWCAVAEIKAGAEPFPMAASSFSGTLVVDTNTGRTYSIAASLSLGRKGAEASIIDAFRSAAPRARAGAYLLPLDGGAAAAVLRQIGSPMKLRLNDVGGISRASGFLALQCGHGKVLKAGAFEAAGDPGTPTPPGPLRGLDTPLLTWEVFDAVGKRTSFPDPDRYSNLLDSMVATKGASFAERVRELQSSGDGLSVKSLSGEDVSTSRPQLRAILSIYS